MKDRLDVMRKLRAGIFILLIPLLVTNLPAPVRLNLPVDPPDDLPTFWRFEAPYSPFLSADSFNRQTGAIRYYLGAPGWSQDNADGELNAVRNAIGQWQSIPDSRIRFEEAGVTGSNLDINLEDGRNLIYWANESTLVGGGAFSISGLPAVSLSSYETDGTILESDIVFNGVDFQWVTSPGDTDFDTVDIESVALHEIGHLLGMAHSTFAGGAMYFYSTFSEPEFRGLSMDEILFARHIYGSAGSQQKYGSLSGALTAGGQPVAGARVVVEDLMGYVIGATATEADGSWVIGGLTPGDYTVRFEPFPRRTATSPETLQRMEDVDFRFTQMNRQSILPLGPESVVVTAGPNTRVDRSATAGNPWFYFTDVLRHQTSANGPYEKWDESQQIQPGEANIHVGVFGINMPLNGVQLQVTHPDIQVGQTTGVSQAVQGFSLLTAPISIPPDIRPGYVSYFVEFNGQRIYANGYLQIADPDRDANFDGLPDKFQREYFSPFTRPESHPDRDPDQDRFPNFHEWRSKTDPTDPASFRFMIDSIEVTADGTLVSWESIPGRNYRLWSRPAADSGSWSLVADNLTATGINTQFLDPTETTQLQFYKVEKLN